MAAFLSVLLRLGAMGSLLAVVLVFLRLVLKYSVPQSVYYYLWLLVLLRLCIPAGITVPLPAGSQIREEVRLQETVSQERHTQAVSLTADKTKEILPGDGEESETVSGSKEKTHSAFPLNDIWKQPLWWMILWGAGVLVCLCRHIGGYLRFSHAVRKSSLEVSIKNLETEKGMAEAEDGETADMPAAIKDLETEKGMAEAEDGETADMPAAKKDLETEREMAKAEDGETADTMNTVKDMGILDMLRDFKLAGRVRLAVCPFVHTPVQLGLFKTMVVLPKGIGDREVLRDILLHELNHIKRHDLLYKWCAMAVTSLHWFNPLMILIRREIGRACELSCDEAVMRGMGAERRRHYGETLLKLAAPPSMSSMLTASLSGEKKRLKERLAAIVKYQKKGMAAGIVSMLLVFIMSSGALVFAVDEPRRQMQTDGESSSSGNPRTAQNGDSDGETGRETDASPAMQSYLPVLEGRDQFYYVPGGMGTETVNLDPDVLAGNINDAGHSIKRMDIAGVPDIFNPDSSTASIWRFAAIDLDGDGGEEIVLQVIDAAGDMGGYLVLHQRMGTVYGYACNYKTFELLKTDGTFAYSNPAGTQSGIGRIHDFTETGCVFEHIVRVEAEPGSGKVSYFKGNEMITETAYNAAYAMQGQKPYAQWHEFTDAGIDEAASERLPGDRTADRASQGETSVDTGLHGYSFPVRISKKRVLTIEMDGQQYGDTYFAVEKIGVYEKKKLIQTIETASLPVPEDYAWDGLFVNYGNAAGEPDIRDLNFDGAEDFGLLAVGTYPKNVPYTYFLWDKETQQFTYGFTLFGSKALKTDDKKRQLAEYWHDTGGRYKNVYGYGPDGTLRQLKE